jgi:large subunit ribosomal protein L16
MLLRPRQTKYRKRHKVRVRGPSSGNIKLAFGSFGLKAVEGGVLTGRQLEATRVSITRALKRTGRLWIRVCPHLPVTSKPAEVRMGKGKGSVAEWVVSLRRGTVLFEIEGLRGELNKSFLKELNYRLPCSIRMISSHL